MDSYSLSRSFWDWAFENPEIISTNHVAIYFFAVENCNRLGWKEKFGFPTQMTMEAIGIKKHQTYIKYFNDLCDFGFFKLIQKSSNQYSANIISLVVAMPKKGKALDKANINHRAKQIAGIGQSTGQSKVPVVKQVNQLTSKPINNKQVPDYFDFEGYVISKMNYKDFEAIKKSLKLKYESWAEAGWVDGNGKEIYNWKTKILNTIPHLKKEENGTTTNHKPTFQERRAEELRNFIIDATAPIIETTEQTNKRNN